MRIFLSLFLMSLLFGTVSGVSVAPGVVLYVHDIVLLVGLLFFFFISRDWKKSSIPKLRAFIGFFIAAGVVSLVVNLAVFSPISLLQGSLYLWRWVAYSCLYWMLVMSHMRPMDMLHRLFLYGCGFGALGIMQFVFYPNLRNVFYLGWDPHYYRLFSTVLDPNFAGILLVLSAILGLYLYSRKPKNTLVFAIGFLIFCVYLTYSRSSYLALTVGVITYAMLQKKWKILGIVVFFVLFIFIVPRPGGNTLRLWREDSTYSRFSNWRESSNLFLRAPIFGHGFNMLREIQTPNGVSESQFVSHAAAGVDSSILFLLVTSGVVGLSTYLILLYRAGALRQKKKEHISMQHLYVSSIVAIAVHSLFVNSLFYPWVMLWLWILIASVELTYDT